MRQLEATGQSWSGAIHCCGMDRLLRASRIARKCRRVCKCISMQRDAPSKSNGWSPVCRRFRHGGQRSTVEEGGGGRGQGTEERPKEKASKKGRRQRAQRKRRRVFLGRRQWQRQQRRSQHRRHASSPAKATGARFILAMISSSGIHNTMDHKMRYEHAAVVRTAAVAGCVDFTRYENTRVCFMLRLAHLSDRA